MEPAIPSTAEPTAPRSRRAARIKAASIASCILFLDAATKAMAASSYQLGEKHELFFLSIIHVQNPGISLGLFTGLGLIDHGLQLPPYVFAVIGILGCISLLSRAVDSPLYWIPIGLILGGGLGNILELVYHGYGTDFIYIGGLNSSANLADFAIFAGTLFFFAAFMARVLMTAVKRRGGLAAGRG